MRIPALRGLSAAAALAVGLGVAVAAPARAAADAPVEIHPVGSDGVFRMVGAGWGHGRGMSQWGAYQAATEGRSHEEILAFYYPGTTLAALGSPDIRVLLASDTGRTVVVRAVDGLTAQQAGADPVVLPSTVSTCSSRITRWRAKARGSYLSLDAYCKRWRKVERVSGSVVTFANPGGLVATQNGQVRRGYRGSITATQVGRKSLQAVNTVPMEQYLRTVVASEVSPSWPEASLRAQAIAARSYAAHEGLGRIGKPFDVYDGVQSQYYPGAVEYDRRWRTVREREHPRTDAAIEATAGIQVAVDGAAALTQFSSSNGGVTAASPLPYMAVAVDDWDGRAARNPRLSWTDSVSAATLARRYPAAGGITAIEVLGREGAGPWGGRITALRVVGSARSYTVTGDSAIRSVLGTNSSLLTFTA
jgi:SpoIID/LytB domain protein